jgi:glycosyltransferase involved in cell wall biosynthesis
VDLPRSHGRRRLGALRAASRALRGRASAFDAVIVADPELTIPAARLRHPCVIWDVQEDTAAALTLKPWLPRRLRRPVAAAVRRLERRAERSLHLVLAEESYAGRFERAHPVVPNSTWVPAEVPPPGPGRVVYVGSVSIARGALDMIAMAEHVGGEVAVHIVGPADAQVEAALRSAHDRGLLVWHGFQPNAVAMELLVGATAGLSLLHDEPNYRHSRPTKILEYFARGIPALSTPLPEAVDLIDRSGGGLVVPFADPAAAAEAVLRLHRDARLRTDLARAAHTWVREHFDWARDGQRWAELVAEWGSSSRG